MTKNIPPRSNHKIKKYCRFANTVDLKIKKYCRFANTVDLKIKKYCRFAALCRTEIKKKNRMPFDRVLRGFNHKQT